MISSTILINYSHVAILGAGWGNTVFVPRLPAGDVFVFGDKTHAPVLNKMADFSIRSFRPHDLRGIDSRPERQRNHPLRF